MHHSNHVELYLFMYRIHAWVALNSVQHRFRNINQLHSHLHMTYACVDHVGVSTISPNILIASIKIDLLFSWTCYIIDWIWLIKWIGSIVKHAILTVFVRFFFSFHLDDQHNTSNKETKSKKQNWGIKFCPKLKGMKSSSSTSSSSSTPPPNRSERKWTFKKESHQMRSGSLCIANTMEPYRIAFHRMKPYLIVMLFLLSP